MTTPLGFRTVHPPARLSGPHGPVAPSRLVPKPVDVIDELSASPSRPIPKDHLELILALIKAGKFTRAVELLDAVWQLDSEHEQAWYFRLWASIGEGKTDAALDLARSVTPRLPGSAAIAYLQAHLEEHVGDTRQALEAALRSSAAAPGSTESATLVQRLVMQVEEEAAGRSTAMPTAEPAPLPHQSGTLSLLGAALLGASLLHPAGSPRPHLAVLPPRVRQPDVEKQRKSPMARRFGLLALATVIAALWAIPDPVPAAIALAIVVVLVTRSAPLR